jgi:uncharacterized protein with PIN domain
MEFAVRHTVQAAGALSPEAHRCPQCRERALVLHRRHVSPPRLGVTLVTEYYDCDFCDARYQFSPAENRWRPISQ